MARVEEGNNAIGAAAVDAVAGNTPIKGVLPPKKSKF